MADEQSFVTPEFVANYVFLDRQKVRKRKNGEDNKYWCLTMRLPHDHEFWEEARGKIAVALANKCPDKLPKNWYSPIKDGDEMEDESFHGNYFIEIKSNTRKPGVLIYNPDGENFAVTNYSEEIYSGMVCVASGRFGGFDNESVGVNAYLNNVLKIDDGERIGVTTASAEEDFEQYVSGGGAKKKARPAGAKAKKSSPLD